MKNSQCTNSVCEVPTLYHHNSEPISDARVEFELRSGADLSLWQREELEAVIREMLGVARYEEVEYYSAYRELREQGLDRDTARRIANSQE